VKYI